MRSKPCPDRKDQLRWFKYHGKGMSVDEIATDEGVKPFVVQMSIDYMEEYKQYTSNEVVFMRVNQTVMQHMDEVDRVLKEGMGATKDIINRQTGKVTKTKSPDTIIRLQAAEQLRKFIETAAPKVPGVQLNQQFNNGFSSSSGGGGLSFESLLRRKRQEKGMANQQEDVIDAEVTDADELKNEFADFGGDDEDEESEDETDE